MSYQQLIFADQRLVILSVLAQDGGYEHNESVLQSLLRHFGHSCSRDQVRTLLGWLKEQGLVSVREIGDYLVGRITQAGIDVASGASSVPGVSRPTPGVS